MTENPTACLIIIGNEILSGRTQDKNLAFLAQGLNSVGISLREVRVIPDIESTIIDTVNSCRKQFSYVFTTGGIGPTHDDITTECIAKAFDVRLHRHPEAERLLRHHYTPEQINESRLKMADVPQGAMLISNPVSAAPGFYLENVYVMAGVPRIMQAMFDSIKHTLVGGKPVLSLSITTNLPEGTLASDLTYISKTYPEVEIGSYPYFKQGTLSTTLVLRSTDELLIHDAADDVRCMIDRLGGAVIAAPAGEGV